MRILLATYGSRGDVEPMVALAVELQALGAEVRLCAPPDEEFRLLLDRAGVSLVPFGRSWRSWATSSSTAEERVPSVDDFVAEYIAATYETLIEAAEGCDMLVASGMLHFTATSVAEKLTIPHRFVVFCPTLLQTQGWHSLIGGAINHHRASIGLPAVSAMRDFMFTEQPWVAADTTLSQDPGLVDLNVVLTDAWFLPDERPLPAELVAFLETGTPPVYVGFGSMRVPEESARVAIEVIRAQGHRVLLARGWAELSSVDDQDDCLMVDEVNQQALFRRVAAVVHHGGAGTTTTAARAGAPQVIVPQAADQPHWASRVAALGVGTLHDGSVPTFETLSTALGKVLTPDTRRAAADLAGMMRPDGARVAARRLLGK